MVLIPLQYEMRKLMSLTDQTHQPILMRKLGLKDM